MADLEWPVPAQPVLGDRDGALARAEYLLYRAAVGFVSHWPRPAQAAFVEVLARTAKALDARHSGAARGYVRQALGSRLDEAGVERTVLAAWKHLIGLTIEDARFNERVLGPELERHFDVELSADARRALDARSGGLFVVPHVGMWEAMPAIGAVLGFRPAYVVSRPPRNLPLSRFAQATREARGYRLIHRHGAIEGLMEVVEKGGWVGLMLDQRARGKTIVAPFFGRPAHCERSIPILVRRLKKPVVFGATYRTARPFHYRTVIDRVLWPEELSRLGPEAIASAINREMERQILVAPEQYFWLHDRYRKAPPLEASGAADPRRD
ncbi:MAG: lysophospholipid acyltransferase family protein [Planctomycetes bacterium]|nr:lysophospholipid acyltransferase family protein [Planctomycetota bacterium]